jgi:hypothetical protein
LLFVIYDAISSAVDCKWIPGFDGEVLTEWERSMSLRGGRWRQWPNGEVVAATWAMVSSAAVRREGSGEEGSAESSWLSLVVRAFVAGHRSGAGCEVMSSTLGPCGWSRGTLRAVIAHLVPAGGGDDTAPLGVSPWSGSSTSSGRNARPSSAAIRRPLSFQG